jgi:hypothetical protein
MRPAPVIKLNTPNTARNTVAMINVLLISVVINK